MQVNVACTHVEDMKDDVLCWFWSVGVCTEFTRAHRDDVDSFGMSSSSSSLPLLLSSSLEASAFFDLEDFLLFFVFLDFLEDFRLGDEETGLEGIPTGSRSPDGSLDRDCCVATPSDGGVTSGTGDWDGEFDADDTTTFRLVTVVVVLAVFRVVVTAALPRQGEGESRAESRADCWRDWIGDGGMIVTGVDSSDRAKSAVVVALVLGDDGTLDVVNNSETALDDDDLLFLVDFGFTPFAASSCNLQPRI